MFGFSRTQKPDPRQEKQNAELNFWQQEIGKMQEWYTGRLPCLYQTPCPDEQQKLVAPNLKDASILTWHHLHQEAKYLAELDLPAGALRGLKVLDLGAGPMPSATCFQETQLYCLDPLLPRYVAAGFPLHYYGPVRFVHAASESIPVSDGFFDAVISVNALDHVDDIRQTAREITRVLKKGGQLRMHVHYHPPYECEPIQLTDELICDLFNACGPLKKLRATRRSFSTVELPPDQSFVLWSNF